MFVHNMIQVLINKPGDRLSGSRLSSSNKFWEDLAPNSQTPNNKDYPYMPKSQTKNLSFICLKDNSEIDQVSKQ
jgi:hypothetical protein